jgi:hypothetical protein
MKKYFAALQGARATRRTVSICTVLLMLAAAPVLAQTPPPAATTPAHSATARPSAPSGLAGDQFSSEQAAKGHCPGDAVVWVNLGGSKAYHLSGNKYYGKTRHGAFMCQKEADQSGFHPAGSRARGAPAKSTTAKTTH